MTDPPEGAESAERTEVVRPPEGYTAAGRGPGSGSGSDSGAGAGAGSADDPPGSGSADDPPRGRAGRRPQRQRKQVLLRLDPAMHDALARWASEELRSTNAQIDYLLRKVLADAGRLPRDARPHPPRGRPPREG